MSNIHSIPKLNDELTFLVNCCKTDPSEELTLNADTPVVKTKEGCDTEFIHSFIQNPKFNIQNVLTLANQHGILPLVYKTLKNLSQSDSARNHDHITLLSNLKSAYAQIAQRNMLMSAELIRIMGLLKEHDIEALAFKGPTLSQMAYGDITLRQYSDLDIYVDRKDIVRIAEILSNDRYNSRVELKYFANEAFLNVNSDVQFYHTNGDVLLEIHWTVFRSSFSNTMKKIDLWNNPQKVHIQNYELATFKTETLLLYLCMHGSKHIWERIEWIVDVDKLIRTSSNIDWEEVYKLSHVANGKTMLELGLNLALQLFNSPLPEDIQNRFIQDKKILQLTSDVLKSLDGKEYFADSELQKNYRHFNFHLSLRDTLLDKTGFIAKTLLPLKSSDVEIVNLPKGLFPLYYVLRPFRLINKYIKNNNNFTL